MLPLNVAGAVRLGWELLQFTDGGVNSLSSSDVTSLVAELNEDSAYRRIGLNGDYNRSSARRADKDAQEPSRRRGLSLEIVLCLQCG